MKSLHNPSRTAVLERLFEVSVLLTATMDSGLEAEGLSRARAQVIWRLRELGPATQRELSQALRCTPRNVTGLVDALEAAGLVVRRPHPTDRRATLVSLTRRGAATVKSWESASEKLADVLFEDLGASDLRGFDAVLNQLVDTLIDTAGADARND